MRVIIVAKTKMAQDACVGSITEDGKSLRLLAEDGSNQFRTTPFQVGQVWEIRYKQPTTSEIDPPHVEDVWVINQTLEQENVDLRSIILNTTEPWREFSSLFNGLLQFSSSGSAYIERASGIPDRSTWFWVLDAPLRWGDSYYYYQQGHHRLKVKYVGFENPLNELPKGTLVRLSLARWWERETGEPKRCYLQLSGWY